MTWLIYRDKCPECPTEPKGEVIRQIFPRYDVCSKNCGILLNIPSWREPEKKVFAVKYRIGEGEWQKMTIEHYQSLSLAVKKFCQSRGV